MQILALTLALMVSHRAFEVLVKKVILRGYKDIVAFTEVEIKEMTDKTYYRVYYHLDASLNILSIDSNKRILNLSHKTYDYLFKYLALPRQKVRVRLVHWFFKMEPLQKKIIYQTPLLR